jgi:hypothetical protein
MRNFLSTRKFSYVAVLSVCGWTWLEETLEEEQLQPNFRLAAPTTRRRFVRILLAMYEDFHIALLAIS